MILGPVKAALEDAGLKKHEVHEIVLVGGSTRIPKIQKLLKDAKPKTGGREGGWKMSRTQQQWLELDFLFFWKPYFETTSSTLGSCVFFFSYLEPNMVIHTELNLTAGPLPDLLTTTSPNAKKR